MSEVDTSANFPRWHKMSIMEPDWFEFRSEGVVLQIYSNWDEDAWILLDASQNPDAEPAQHKTLYQHGSLAEVQTWGLSWACDALRQQLSQAREEALEEAVKLADDALQYHEKARQLQISVGNTENAEHRAASMSCARVMASDIRALITTTQKEE